ncbi:MAG: tyrosine-protein phosphatase [Propionibacteriaceae bacterium]|nr:tyrosine-protein phosphatase [Propionibacteriaceae bacterium]
MTASPTDWPDLLNFRDLGGHRGADGRLVKRGRLYRGTALNNATDDDLAKLANLGVGLVFDLRARSEATGRPDRLPAGATYRREPGVPSMDEVHRELLDWSVLIGQLSASDEMLTSMESFQGGIYGEMIERPQAYQALLGELLAQPSRAVYMHCSAGKDRTGVAGAIILTLLGVDYDDIMADYLVSAKYPQPDYAAVAEMAGQAGPRIGRLIGTMLTVTKPQLDFAFAHADQVWGSWDGFVQDGLGLTHEDVAALRRDYLS